MKANHMIFQASALLSAQTDLSKHIKNLLGITALEWLRRIDLHIGYTPWHRRSTCDIRIMSWTHIT